MARLTVTRITGAGTGKKEKSTAYYSSYYLFRYSFSIDFSYFTSFTSKAFTYLNNNAFEAIYTLV